jgi:membrane-bound lytic murein transglycosylase D
MRRRLWYQTRVEAPTRTLAVRGVVMRWLRRCPILLLAVAATALASASASASEALFPRPKSLEPAVAFWRSIFGTFTEEQDVFHDDVHLDKIYGVVDYRDRVGPDGELSTAAAIERDREVRAEKVRIQQMLLRIHRLGPKSSSLTAEERRIAAMFANVPGRDKYKLAAERVRSQVGLRKRFAAGLSRRAGYLTEMKEIFRRRGLPTELTVMPLFESCFDLDAYSKVGAAGVWQFMPATGRHYMRVDSAIDERRDPIRSTEAAAEHLRRDYESLDSWPLAITAYNHGRGGMYRAASQLGTKDIGVIVQRYKGKTFGFASRNFYAEFLAALDVVARQDEIYGKIRVQPAPQGREIKLRQSMRLREASRVTGVPREHLIAMNPAFLSMVIRGSGSIPAGYRLRVPEGARDVQVAMAQPGASERAATKQDPDFKLHTVRRGQTLAGIAKRYNTSVRKLQGLNGVRSPKALRVGQKLKVPG